MAEFSGRVIGGALEKYSLPAPPKKQHKTGYFKKRKKKKKTEKNKGRYFMFCPPGKSGC